MLAYQWQSSKGLPVVFLHGLLGSAEDWQPIFRRLQKYPKIRPLALDLPYHGNSRHLQCQGFDDVRQLLHTTLQLTLGEQPFCLVGYSLGGRIALDYTLHAFNPYLQATYLEGANIGLVDQHARSARLANDSYWAARFRDEPIERVLDDWYRQPIFSHLTSQARLALVQTRRKNSGAEIAAMLEATSLAKQPFWGEEITQYLSTRHFSSDFSKLIFLIGEYDHKFRQMVETYQLPYHLVAQAGHNAHQENPEGFVEILLEKLFTYCA